MPELSDASAGPWERWNAQQCADEELTEYEQDREEVRDLIITYARRGRLRDAWIECRLEIQIHLENRPDDRGNVPDECRRYHPSKNDAQWEAYTVKCQADAKLADANWRAQLTDLLALRRGLPEIVAKARRRMPEWLLAQQDARSAFMRGHAA